MKKRQNSRFTLVSKYFLSRSKRSQTTIFIVLAILIVAIILAFVLINQTSTQSNIEKALSKLGIASQTSIVQSSIIDCLEETAKDSTIVIGLQGGYYNPPERISDLDFIFIPYYYYEGEFSQPSKTKIQTELSAYIDDNIDFCVDNILFQDFTLNRQSSNSKALINRGEISYETDLSIIITKDGSTADFQLKDHKVTMESPLFAMLEVATFITESHKEDPDLICVSCVADMAEERNLFVDFLDFGETEDEFTTLVIISEDQTSEEIYVFEFLNKYPSTIPII